MLTIPEAAAVAEVLPEQVRLWCKAGQVIAEKDQRRRWLIDPVSLDALIASWEELSEVLEAAGGERWDREVVHRVYFNDALAWAGLEFTEDDRGRLKTATLDGQLIIDVNGSVHMLRHGIGGVFVNLAAPLLYIQCVPDLTKLPYISEASGESGTVNLLERIVAAVAERTGVCFGEPAIARRGYAVPILSAEPQEAS